MTPDHFGCSGRVWEQKPFRVLEEQDLARIVQHFELVEFLVVEFPSIEDFGWIGHSAGLKIFEELDDFLRLKDFFDLGDKLGQFLPKLRSLSACFHKAQQLFANEISRGVLCSKSFPDSL